MIRTLVLASALIFGLNTAASAADKPTLNIYTYDAFAADYGPGPGLKQGFEQQCDCTLNWIAVDSSIGALRRVQLEGDSTEADIILGLDTSTAGEAAATGLFAPSGVDISGLKLPNDWTSDMFVPFDYGYFAFVYDKTKLPDPPHSFEQLADAGNHLKIVIEDPRSETPGLGLVLWIKAAYGDDAPEVWKGLKPHIVTITQGWSEAYDLFLAGEADMVLSYTTSPAYHLLAEDNDDYAFAPFDEGHYAQIEVAGVLKSSAHKALARRFLNYLVTPEAQGVIPETNWMFPVADVPLAAGFGTPLPADKVLLMDSDKVTANKDAWIEEMLGAVR